MTATATAPPRAEQAAPRRRDALVAMLERSGLELRVTADDAAACLAAAFERYPPGHPHGGLLGAALTGSRDWPADQRAVRHLLARGQLPTVRAVRALVAQSQTAAAAQPARLAARSERLAPIAERDGERAAEVVIDWWRRRGRPPTPTQLGRALGWPPGTFYAVCYHLIERGWLHLDDQKQLQPGPRDGHRGPVNPAR